MVKQSVHLDLSSHAFWAFQGQALGTAQPSPLSATRKARQRLVTARVAPTSLTYRPLC